MYNQFFRLVEKFMDDKTRNKITLLCGRSECLRTPHCACIINYAHRFGWVKEVHQSGPITSSLRRHQIRARSLLHQIREHNIQQTASRPFKRYQINTGRLVPEEYYFCRELERGEEEAERVHLGVWRNKSHTVSYQVEKPATILKWEIQSLKYDIAFGLTLEDGLNPPLEIVSFASHAAWISVLGGEQWN